MPGLGQLVGRVRRRSRFVGAALAGVALLYLAAVNARWSPSPDSALYLGLGRNLAQGRGYTFLGRSQTRTEPMVPLLGAASYRLFGDSFLPLNLLYSGVGLAAAGMVYVLARQAGEAAWGRTTGRRGDGATARRGGPDGGSRSADRGSGGTANARPQEAATPEADPHPASSIRHPSSSREPAASIMQHPEPAVGAWAGPLACGLAVALSWRVYFESTRLLTEVPFLLLALGGFWAAGRIASRAEGSGGRTGRWGVTLAWSLAAWGLLLGATLTRLIGATFLAALAAGLLLPFGRVGEAALGWRRRAVALAPGLLAAGALAGWIVAATRRPGPLSAAFYRFEEAPLLLARSFGPRMLRAVVELPAAALEAFWGQHWAPAGYVVVAVMLIGMVRLARRRQWLLLTPVWCYVPALLVIGPSAIEARYLMPLIGWMAIWFFSGLLAVGRLTVRRPAGRGTETDFQSRDADREPGHCEVRDPQSALASAAGRSQPARRMSLVLWAGLAVLVAPALPRIARLAFYHSHHRDYYGVVDHGKWSGYVAAADWLRARTGPGVRVFTDEPRVVEFLSGRTCSDRPSRVPQQSPSRARRWARYAAEDGCDLVVVVGGRDDAAVGHRVLSGDRRFRLIYGQVGPNEDITRRGWRGRFLVFERVAPPAASGPG